MTAAMLVIPIVDGMAKYLSADFSPLFVSWARYAASTALILPIAFARNGRRMFPSDGIPLHALRTLCLVGAMTLYFFAISKVSLVIAASAYFVGPLVAVALSVTVLGERLTTTKVAGMLVGLIGALIVLKPSGNFDAYVILALCAGCLFAIYLVITRRTSVQSEPIRALSFQCFFGTLLLTPPALFVAEIPAYDLVPLFIGLGLFSLLGHFLTIIAFQKAEASTLAPLVYVELIGAAAIGFFFFSDVPTLLTIVGAVLIATSGLIVTISAKRRSSH
ncbi:DMT family transporter [Sulfitobacter sp. F26204]|uniref:DMT family transporter n=1 Tax=Sulfitobacter sp. F26204 TaxID=2996014 RepID=UPI00225E4572|nr:DMT family transporter [Sulfitobacter sp. F26204]